MRALILQTPERPDSIALLDQALPEPGAQQVRIRFTSMGLNRADLLYCQGRYFYQPVAGSRLGFEGAGIVDKLGSGLDHTAYKPGDRVAILPMSFDLRTQGCYAEYGVYDVDSLIATPAGIDDSESGGIWMAFLTAWGGMVSCGGLSQHETVVITAASSSVGIACIQVAKLRGAKVIATTSDSSKCASLREYGADLVIVTPANLEGAALDQSNEDYVSKVREFTGGKGSDLVFDAVAGPASYALVKGSAQGGRIVFQGMLDRRPMNIHAGVLMKRRLTLRGYMVDETLENPIERQRAIDEISIGCIKKQLKPVIAEKHALSSYRQAFAQLKENRHIGKIVLTANTDLSENLP